jgi:hypothetical protein
MKIKICSFVFALATVVTFAGNTAPTVSGDYLEVRSCDVYTGSCFANAEMNLTGKEGMMVWSVREGAWKGHEARWPGCHRRGEGGCDARRPEVSAAFRATPC